MYTVCMNPEYPARDQQPEQPSNVIKMADWLLEHIMTTRVSLKHSRRLLAYDVKHHRQQQIKITQETLQATQRAKGVGPMHATHEADREYDYLEGDEL